MGDYGLKVSKPNKDVLTATDVQDLVFTSGKNVLGIRQITNYTVTTDSNGEVDETHAHGFGYIPIAFVFVTTYSGKVLVVPNEGEESWSMTELLSELFKFEIDGTNIRLRVYAHHYEDFMGGTDTPLSGQNYTFKVIYFYNELTNTS